MQSQQSFPPSLLAYDSLLMLQQSQGTLDHDVLQDRSRRNINGAAFCGNDNNCALESDASSEVDGSGDGQMVELDDLRNAANALLEVRDLLEVIAKFDERSWAEAVGVNL